MTSAERQKAYKARQRDAGRKQMNVLVTDDEAFYIQRLLKQMRATKAVPAMMRRPNGTLEAFDA